MDRGTSVMSKEEFLDKLKRPKEERDMIKVIRESCNAVLEQIDEHELIVGALNFEVNGEASIIQKAVTEICKTEVLNVAAYRHGATIAIAVTKYKIKENLLQECAIAALGKGNGELPQLMAKMFVDSLGDD